MSESENQPTEANSTKADEIRKYIDRAYENSAIRSLLNLENKELFAKFTARIHEEIEDDIENGRVEDLPDDWSLDIDK